jgi:EGF domain
MIRSIALALSFVFLLLVPARAQNACASNPCSPNATCTTTGPATFSCTCKTGYSGDGKTCVEINACVSNPCDSHATCSRTGPGTFACSCNAGYRGNGLTCAVINACASTPSPCDPNAECISAGPGTHTCTCHQGYEGDGRTCRRIAVTQPSPSTISPKPASPSAFAIVDLDRSVAPSVYVPVGSEVRAFIATGSTGPVIGSLSDCSPCNITFASFTTRNFANQDGVLVTVIFSAATPANQVLKVTFQQQGLTDTSVIKAPTLFNGQ